jgi:hypothetical protein
VGIRSASEDGECRIDARQHDHGKRDPAMTARHRRHDDGRFNGVFAVVTAAVVFAAVVSAAVVYFLGSSVAYRTDAPRAAVPPEPVSQQGTLVAVTPDYVTARSANGFARTYLINGETTAITGTGNRIGSASTAFAVNDEVSIFAVVQDGTAVATTVAGREVSELNGPPMDSVAIP